MYMRYNIVFLDNYLDPAVLMPLILYAVLWERRILLSNQKLVLSNTEIAGYTLLMVIFGEVIFPLFSEKFTADYWDILAYTFGTLTYIITRKVSNTST